MKLEFLPSGPALLVENTRRVLVVADLHLGIETDLARHGLHFKSRSNERKERVVACIHESDPDCLVLLGDIKHSIPVTSRQEYREIPGIFEKFRSLLPIRVLPGNHDVGLERFLAEDEIMQKDGAVIDGCGYLHGHTYPNPSLSGRFILCGHHHPVVRISDEVGCALKSPAYLLADLDEKCLNFGKTPDGGRAARVLFVPAFNELSGYDITRTVNEPFSPLSRCIKRDQSEVFLPDGTYLGPLASVEDYEGDQSA
ncbi:MAG TPA: metallophosphoesterase [Methanoregulaceae archaeon]|nr:metallophosphoesterase [Methanoregulaceae archaeon]